MAYVKKMARKLNSKTPLLDLPAEVRNQIFIEVLIREQPIVLRVWLPMITEPPLLATSRRIRDEAMPIFYGGNVFTSRRPSVMKQFLEHCSDEQLPLFRSIRAVQPLGWEYFTRSEWITEMRKHAAPLVKRYGRGLLCADAILVPLPKRAKNGTLEISWTGAGKLETL